MTRARKSSTASVTPAIPMANRIAIDVGYRQVKAVSARSRISFPSSVAPARTFSASGIARLENYQVTIDGEPFFVGDLAEREASNSLIEQTERTKHHNQEHDVLILTAARLLNAEPGCHLAVGLPIAYFADQRVDLQRSLTQLEAEVSVDGMKPREIFFDNIIVYPQGAAALLTLKSLPQEGMVSLIDIGQRTTDYITARIQDGRVTPVLSQTGSIEIGVADYYRAIGEIYQAHTGAPANGNRIQDVIKRQGRIAYRRKIIDLSDDMLKAQTMIAKAIGDRIKKSLAEIHYDLDAIYMAGGGSHVFPRLVEDMQATVIEDPVWANSLGFLKLLE
ncbi:ParM/StbA family protein [Heliorestis convoluta]|uniref:Uncharacterized protein n=1 Tax=Heliorestis convoluta TaxID=356322 RepID=A0A5Q2N0R9_9FIRM|nr:ParM/StbA family protein [Heliorestis convoluta]QGG48598.1 hypothetical protein FTV88_2505 [Heliorestis convoluta]